MPFTLPGNRIWEYTGPALTVAASPLVTAWFDTTGYTNVLPSFKFTNSTGTTTFTIEGSFDGSTLDADLTALYGAPVQATSLPVLSPYFRVRLVQATADSTVTKVFLQARQ